MRWSNSRILFKIICNNKKFKYLMTLLIKTKIGCQRNLVPESTELMTNNKEKKTTTGGYFSTSVIQIWITMLTRPWVGSLLKPKHLAQIAILCSGCRLLIHSTSRGGAMATRLRRPLSYLLMN